MKRILAIGMAVLLIFAFSSSIAVGEESKVLRVGFAQVNGLSMKDEDGARYGVIVDYLNEIAKYTNWRYEYIDTENEDLVNNFIAGEYDLIGGCYYSEAFETFFAYPHHNCGSSKAVLLARWDDETISSYNLQELNGKVIGVLERAKENQRRLEEFLSFNGLNCTLRMYSAEEAEDGNLYARLENGEVDLLLGNAADDNGKFRAVAEFDAQSHYIVTQPGNQEILDGLNMALENIMKSNPNFADESYQKNFPNAGINMLTLDSEERAYIEEKETITVAIPGDFHPFYCLDNDNETHDGITVDILERVARFSDLQVSYILTESYAQALQIVLDGKADVLGFYLGNEEESAEIGLALTKSYTILNDLIVRNKSVTYPSDGLTCAMLDGRQMPSSIEASKVIAYPSIYDSISAVNSGEADFAYGLSARLESEMQQHVFSNVVPVSIYENSNDISFAVARPANAKLLTILNKAINSVTQRERNNIISDNLISRGNPAVSLENLIYSNPVLAIGLAGTFFALICMIAIITSRAKIRTIKMRSELEKAEADSRAKSDFLSRMSHEIRTPMNAIVGLTDLIDAEQDVPEKVRHYLMRLKTSARYLLELINDILDMSRIDSGKLTINSEPFSLTQMLDELESMMKSEATRKGLSLKMKVDIQQDGYNGDVTRLKQVLTNLLSNAIKFTPHGGEVLLEVQGTAAEDAASSISFAVTDNGVGILHEDQERVFNAFEQAGSTSSRSQGTGLGLPISRSIVQLMGGELTLTSEPNHGCRFAFTLTLPHGIVAEKMNEMSYATNLFEGTCFLLAEDNDINAEITSGLLEGQGALVTRAVNGQEAVELFSASEPDTYKAILMDVQMPVMNGLEATKAIRAMKRPDAASIPIIATTANTFQEDIIAAEEAGMNEFVTKPMDINRLYTVLYKFTRE